MKTATIAPRYRAPAGPDARSVIRLSSRSDVRQRPLRRLVPDRPGRIAARVDVLELLSVLERVHRHPEAIVLVGRELPAPDQPMERLHDELFAVPHVVEDFL